jgi:hypothetical protein
VLLSGGSRVEHAYDHWVRVLQILQSDGAQSTNLAAKEVLRADCARVQLLDGGDHRLRLGCIGASIGLWNGDHVHALSCSW